MVDKEQPVAQKPDTAAAAATEGDKGAQDQSLDDVLAEFDAGTETPAKPVEQPADDVTARIKKLEQDAQERDQQDQLKDVQAAVTECVEQISTRLPEDLSLPKRAVRGMVEVLAQDDKRIAQAFANRLSNPKAWDRVLGKLADEIADEFKDAGEGSSNRAVAAAVRSASTRASEPEQTVDDEKVRGMSIDELYKEFPGLGRQ